MGERQEWSRVFHGCRDTRDIFEKGIRRCKAQLAATFGQFRGESPHVFGHVPTMPAIARPQPVTDALEIVRAAHRRRVQAPQGFGQQHERRFGAVRAAACQHVIQIVGAVQILRDEEARQAVAAE